MSKKTTSSYTRTLAKQPSDLQNKDFPPPRKRRLKNKSTTLSRNHIPYPQRTKDRSSRYLHSEHKSQRRTQITSLGWDEETMIARTEHKQQSHDFKLIPTRHKIPSPTLPRDGNKFHRQSSRSGSPASTEGSRRSDLKPCTSPVFEMLQIYRLKPPKV